MKKLLSVFIATCSIVSYGQTLYVPSGTSGIGSSANGNVGIGTASPRGQFDVASGDVYLSQNTVNGASQSLYLPGHIYISPYPGSNISYLQARRSDNSGTSALRLRTVNSGSLTEAMHIEGNGNVGIGTTSPSHKLSVGVSNTAAAPWASVLVSDGLAVASSGNSTATYLYNQSQSGIHGINAFDYSSSTYLPLHIGWGGGNVFLAKDGGNVGIGTTSPDGFQVNASLTSETSQGSSNIRMGMLGGTPRLIFDYSGSTPFEIDNFGGRLRIFKPGTELFSINSAGGVAIGTTNPGSYKLAVEGKIGAREVNVIATNPWPDYVFEKNYKLPSLEEIKNYIDQNQHLPEVPTAKEVEKNGVNLSEMNALLLKKIEELTLLMIEMKDENKAMKKEIQDLKTKK